MTQRNVHVAHPSMALGAMARCAGSLDMAVRAPRFRYDFECLKPVERSDAPRLLRLAEAREVAKRARHWAALRAALDGLARIPMERAWADVAYNVVTDVGCNDLLDKYFAAGTGPSWFMGLISSASYTTGPAVGNTAASHAGWTEAGPTNAPNYSEANRPAVAWNAAAARSKATSSACVFTSSGTGTVKGGFLISNNTKGGTTGILYSAALFSGGDQPLVPSNVLNVTATVSQT